MKTIIAVSLFVVACASGVAGYGLAYQTPVIVPADLIKLAGHEGLYCSGNKGPEKVVLRRAMFDAQHDDVTFVCSNDAHFFHVPYQYSDPAIERKKREEELANQRAAGLLPSNVILAPWIPDTTISVSKVN